MPAHMYYPNDPCYTLAIICNVEGEPIEGYPLFVILDVYGQYFFAPSFGEFDYYEEVFPEGETIITVLPEFNWPPDTGSASGIIWYGAMTDPAVTELFGTLGTFEFGWRDIPPAAQSNFSKIY